MIRVVFLAMAFVAAYAGHTVEDKYTIIFGNPTLPENIRPNVNKDHQIWYGKVNDTFLLVHQSPFKEYFITEMRDEESLLKCDFIGGIRIDTGTTNFVNYTIQPHQANTTIYLSIDTVGATDIDASWCKNWRQQAYIRVFDPPPTVQARAFYLSSTLAVLIAGLMVVQFLH
eukprot:26080_1